jgi:4-hydroxy-2-oxoheptanedioate aldolase
LNILKERAKAGDRLFGAWLALASVETAEVMAYAGFDFLVIDNEHGQGTVRDAVNLIRVCHAAGTPCIVRIPWNDPIYLKRILDAGANSLMVPMVESPQEAAELVAACRYPPLGRRGFAATSQRCSRFGIDQDYVARSAEDLFLIAQVESAVSVEQSEKIASTDGIDMVLIGVNDLSGSIGLLGELDHPDVRRLVGLAEDSVRRAGKLLGTVPTPQRDTNQLFDDGYSLVAGPVDSILLCQSAVSSIRSVRSGGS